MNEARVCIVCQHNSVKQGENSGKGLGNFPTPEYGTKHSYCVIWRRPGRGGPRIQTMILSTHCSHTLGLSSIDLVFFVLGTPTFTPKPWLPDTLFPPPPPALLSILFFKPFAM